MRPETAEAIVKRFKLVCRECGSENCVLTAEEGIDYGVLTGYSPGMVSGGCNDCKKNDLIEYD
jgi:hypothetical protein